MSEAHARLGPSNHRWPYCPGSVREEAKYPDIPGAAAIDGTGSHLLLEMCLLNGVRAEAYDGQIIGTGHHDEPNGWLVSKERIDRVQMCLDYVNRRYQELQQQFPGATITVEAESKSDPGGMYGRDDWWGTVDITITVMKDDRCLFIEICDYKDGRGWVSEKNNTQFTSYAAGKMRPFIAAGTHIKWPEMVGACRLTVVQPKTNPPVRYEEPTPQEVVDRATSLAEAAERTDDPNAPLIPDDKGGKGYCRWCKHRDNCEALNGAGTEALKVMIVDENTSDLPLFEQLNTAVGNIESLSNEQLADLADTKARVMAIYDKVLEEIQNRVEQGNAVPGYAMRPGKGSRVWNAPEEDIAKMLKGRKWKKDDIYPPKLISPAQVLKSDKLDEKQKERIEKEFISFRAGNMTLQKVAREQAPEQTVEMMFADVPRVDATQPSTPQVEEPAPVSFL